MPILFNYLLKLSLSLGVVYLFYQLVLRRLTFYNWNRWYLLGYTLLSLFIPFINISTVLKENRWSDTGFVEWVPVIGEGDSDKAAVTSHHSSLSAWDIMTILFLVGATIMLLRLLIQVFSFSKMTRKAKLISNAPMNIFQVDDSIIPFSFGNSIFINRNLHTEQELQEIIRHEFVHVKQRHTADIIWAELLCLFNWYNPFAWLLKASIRQNLEFIADDKVLENGINKKQYQYLLLKVIGNRQFSIASQFNFSSLKKRIAMMNKLRSAKVHAVKFLFVLPVFSVVLLAFRNEQKKDDFKPMINFTSPVIEKQARVLPAITTLVLDTVPEKKAQSESKTNIEKLEIDESKATVRLKDGTIEKYNLEKADEKATFEKKYGKIINVSAKGSNGSDLIIVSESGSVKYITPTSLEPVTVKGANTTVTLVPLTATTLAGTQVQARGTGATTLALSEAAEPVTVTGVALNRGVNVISTAPATLTLVNGTNVQATRGTSVPLTLVNGTEVQASRVTTVLAPMNPYAGEGVNIYDGDSPFNNGKVDMLFTISKNTTREQLEEFKKQMKAKDVDLNYTDIEYNDKGVLTYISGTLDSKDGKQNFVGSDFEKVVISTITTETRKYFRVTVKGKEII